MKEPATDLATIDQYIEGFAEPIRSKLSEMRATIRAAAPEATERISYQMPTFFLEGNLVHFGAFKNHIGFYPTPNGVEGFREELARYKGAKGSVQFPLDEPLPLKLISRIVEYRVAQNRAAAAAKRKR